MKRNAVVLDAVLAGSSTSQEVSERTGIPRVQCANALLELHEIGSLTRKAQPHEKGKSGHPGFRYLPAAGIV